MHKKDVLTAGPPMLSDTAKPRYKNNAFGVRSAIKRLFGNHLATGLHDSSIGSSYGFVRVILSDYLVNSLVIVPLNLRKSRITGFKNVRKMKLIILRFVTLSLMQHISIRTAVS
jgi:hypothetical protein